jgi:hypothetical protein
MIETEFSEPPSVRIAFLDVGQADTIIITSPETHEAFVLDCVNPKAVLDYLKREEIRYLRGIIVTHLTEATDQCRAPVSSIRQDVLSTLGTQVSKTGYPLLGSKKGCPCAGTVIIELSDSAQILQPESRFHREDIIKTYFTSHKCNI